MAMGMTRSRSHSEQAGSARPRLCLSAITRLNLKEASQISGDGGMASGGAPQALEKTDDSALNPGRCQSYTR